MCIEEPIESVYIAGGRSLTACSETTQEPEVWEREIVTQWTTFVCINEELRLVISDTCIRYVYRVFHDTTLITICFNEWNKKLNFAEKKVRLTGDVNWKKKSRSASFLHVSDDVVEPLKEMGFGSYPQIIHNFRKCKHLTFLEEVSS